MSITLERGGAATVTETTELPGDGTGIRVRVRSLIAESMGVCLAEWFDLDDHLDSCDPYESLRAEISQRLTMFEFVIDRVESPFELPDLIDAETLIERAAEIWEAVELHGTEAFADYIDVAGGLAYALQSYEDAYEGKHRTLEAFAWQWLDDVYPEMETVPGIRMEIDTVAWNCDYTISDNGHVFRSV